jgi:hypothetical protein
MSSLRLAASIASARRCSGPWFDLTCSRLLSCPSGRVCDLGVRCVHWLVGLSGNCLTTPTALSCCAESAPASSGCDLQDATATRGGREKRRRGDVEHPDGDGLDGGRVGRRVNTEAENDYEPDDEEGRSVRPQTETGENNKRDRDQCDQRVRDRKTAADHPCRLAVVEEGELLRLIPAPDALHVRAHRRFVQRVEELTVAAFGMTEPKRTRWDRATGMQPAPT